MSALCIKYMEIPALTTYCVMNESTTAEREVLYRINTMLQKWNSVVYLR